MPNTVNSNSQENEQQTPEQYLEIAQKFLEEGKWQEALDNLAAWYEMITRKHEKESNLKQTILLLKKAESHQKRALNTLAKTPVDKYAYGQLHLDCFHNLICCGSN